MPPSDNKQVDAKQANRTAKLGWHSVVSRGCEGSMLGGGSRAIPGRIIERFDRDRLGFVRGWQFFRGAFIQAETVCADTQFAGSISMQNQTHCRQEGFSAICATAGAVSRISRHILHTITSFLPD